MHGAVDLTAGEPNAAAGGTARWPGSTVAAALLAAVESGRLNLPLPGGGRTRERWAVLADLAGDDLSLARLAEGHADALAILAELGEPAPPAGSRWGVWAAQPPGPGLTARRAGRGWRLDGIKQYCSGALRSPMRWSRRRRRTGVGCSRPARPIWSPWRVPGQRSAWQLATRSTSGSPASRPSRWAAPAAISTGQASRTAAREWRPAGTAGPAGSAGRCWPSRPSVTSARTPQPISARWTSRCIPPGRCSRWPPARSTLIRRTARTAANCAPCGCVPSGSRLHRGHAAGGPRSGRGTALPRRGACAPGGGPDRVPASASRRAQLGRTRRARS